MVFNFTRTDLLTCRLGKTIKKWVQLFFYVDQTLFVMFSGLLFTLFAEAVVCPCKAENIAIYFFFYTCHISAKP